MPVCSCRIAFREGDFAVIPIQISAVPPWSLDAQVPRLGAFRTEQRDLFDALCRFREWLATHNALILVQGATRNVYPSGMQRESGGRTAYRFTSGKIVDRGDVTDILSPAERSDIGSVAEQHEHWELWVKSISESATQKR
jgi:hypothetical protein